MALVWHAVLRASSLDPGLSKSVEETAARGQIGRWLLCESQYPPVIEIPTGAEFGALLIVDEHGKGSVRSLVYHLQTAQGSPTAVIACVHNDNQTKIKRALDSGTAGTRVPRVDSLFFWPIETIEPAAGGYGRLTAENHRLTSPTGEFALLRSGSAGLMSKV